jgi:uncharacterized protein
MPSISEAVLPIPAKAAEPLRPASQRTALLDALRGFALFGVVWSNYVFFAAWIWLSPAEKAVLPGAVLDVVLVPFHDILIDGKFYSIFSLLFGIGFGFFLDKGTAGRVRFIRRMVLLLLIGWLHLRYLWAGDILTLYAALGLMLPLFRRVGDRALLVIATVLILSPIAVDPAVILSGGSFDPVAPIDRALAADEARNGPLSDALRGLPAISWQGLEKLTERTVLLRAWIVVSSNRPQKVLGLFLIGLWIARRKLYADPQRHRPLLKRVFFGGLLLGLPFCTLNWYSTHNLPGMPDVAGLVATISYALGVVPLALAYASGFALLWTDPRWQGRLQVLAPMGRMALTNYLMQTIIAIALFYGVGLGWGLKSLVAIEAIAVAVFITQVLWSHWWLRRFQFGPMEWLWRSFTYGKVMPWRKERVGLV